MTEPKIQQLYEDVSASSGSGKAGVSSATLQGASVKSSGSATASSTAQSSVTTALPKINARPNSAARGSHVTSAPLRRLTRIDSAKARVKQELPLTPLQAVEKYSRHLTAFEQEEIMAYPQVWFVGHRAKKINANASKPNNCGYDDEKGRYKCVKHDHIGYRYEIMRGLGKGSFGDVVETFDHKNKQPQAVKIIRNERRFHRQAQIEVKILEQLKRSDRRRNHHVVHINEYFMFRNHLCITFDLMHQDLYTALKKDGFKGFTLTQVSKFCHSLLSCLRLLRRQRVIHCDLKPENILLNERHGDDITVIDFGSACLEHQKIHSYIQSRFYRAPEIILGTGYSIAIDMWSLGCILAELYTGQPIFPGRDEKEQLMYQMEVLGVPPATVLRSAKRTSVFFHSDGSPRVTTDRKGRVHRPGAKPLHKAVRTTNEAFLDFLQRCFDWNPHTRMTPKEATKHPWLNPDAAHRLMVESAFADSQRSDATAVERMADNMARIKTVPNPDQYHEVTIPSDAPATATNTGGNTAAAATKPTAAATVTTTANTTAPSSAATATTASASKHSGRAAVRVHRSNSTRTAGTAADSTTRQRATRPSRMNSTSTSNGGHPSAMEESRPSTGASSTGTARATTGVTSISNTPLSRLGSTARSAQQPQLPSQPAPATSSTGSGLSRHSRLRGRQAWASVKLDPIEPQGEKQDKASFTRTSNV